MLLTVVKTRIAKRREFVLPAARLALLILFGAFALRAQAPPEDAEDVNPQLVGHAAPNWSTEGWINSKPIDVKDLRGKVVLLRFLNDDAAGAATLVELERTYRDRGFAVVGIFNPTPMPAETSLDTVRDFATAQGFDFPVGLDSHWATLNRYWPEGAVAELTASAFLIDRKGIVRFIQPDPLYEKNSRNKILRKQYATFEKAIELLLTSADGGATRANK